MNTRFAIPPLLAGAVLPLANSTSAKHFSADELNRCNIERRAVEAVIWGVPAVNYDLMLHE